MYQARRPRLIHTTRTATRTTRKRGFFCRMMVAGCVKPKNLKALGPEKA
jgi:hypothetical protein